MKQGEIESCLPLLLPVPGMWHMNHGAALSLTGSMHGAGTFPSSGAWKQESGTLDRKYSIIFIFPFLPAKSYMEQKIHQFHISEEEKYKPQPKSKNNCLNQTRTKIQTENKISCPILKLYIKSKAFICHLLSFLHQEASSSCWFSSSQPWSLSSDDYCTKGSSLSKSQSLRS